MMRIEKFVIGGLSTNCYLLKNEETKELLIVDPASCPEYLTGYIKTYGYTPKGILLTHAHFDHVMGIDALVKEFGIPVYVCEGEERVLADPNLNLATMVGKQYSYTDVTVLKRDEVFPIAGFELKVIHTPGHTCGGCCYYEEKEGVLISGDTLFSRSVGRSDFPTGDMTTLIESIKQKLFCLPDDVMVYPGHGELTCIGDEKLHNPFVL